MYEKEKKEILYYVNKIISRNLAPSVGGSISMFIRDEGIILITPSFIEHEKIELNDIIEMKLDGTQLAGLHLEPSSEWKMHALVYKNRKDINAFIHSHPIYCMAVAAVGPLPASNFLIALSGNHEVPLADYATYGTSTLADNSWKYLKDNYAVLLKNHGLNTIGKDLSAAFIRLELIEACAKVYIKSTSIGKPTIIDKKEMDSIIKSYKI